MSRTPEQEDQDANEEVVYFEAELFSLKEEITYPVAPKRKEFVLLRIARIEKQLPVLREKAGKARKARANAEWLARVNHPKRG